MQAVQPMSRLYQVKTKSNNNLVCYAYIPGRVVHRDTIPVYTCSRLNIYLEFQICSRRKEHVQEEFIE